MALRYGFFMVVVAGLLVSAAVLPALAQEGDVVWSEPINLSNTPSSSKEPAIVADGYGYVHVFWCEDVGGPPVPPGEHGPEGNTILHRRWDGQSWSPAIDIVFVPGETLAAYPAVDVDHENRLHIVWTGQSNIYYSQAASAQAHSARAWSEPIAVTADSARSRFESDVAVDSQGNVHVFYATRMEDPGVYHVQSRDGGKSWLLADKLSDPLDGRERSFSHVRAVADEADRLHVVWQTNDADGYGMAVYYARSTDRGETWTAPLLLRYAGPDEKFVDWPYLAVRGESELHLIYTNGTNIGRAHRISIDGGETWSQPYGILMDLEGVTGYDLLVVDGMGQMHLIANMRTRQQIGGFFHLVWSGTGWSPWELVTTGNLDNSWAAHLQVATVRLGSEIHVVWNNLLGEEIGYMRGVITGVDPIAAEPMPTPTPRQPAATAQVTTYPAPAATGRPGPSVTVGDLPAPAPDSRAFASPILIGAVAAMCLILTAVLWSWRRPH